VSVGGWLTFRRADAAALDDTAVIGEPWLPDDRPELSAAELRPQSCNVVVSIDATTSRLWYWAVAVDLQDRLLAGLPPHFKVALAVYRNSLDTFTPFVMNRSRVRTRAARIPCDGAIECLPEVLAYAARSDVAAVINITDLTAFVDERPARKQTRKLKARGTPVFILADPDDDLCPVQGDYRTLDMYDWITSETATGALLPFDAAGVSQLLERLAESKQLLIGSSKR
jgi:pimeloyl-ACP methyl ester carboxylesterase